MRERESIPSEVQSELASYVAGETSRLARQTASGRSKRKVARLTKGDGALGSDPVPVPEALPLGTLTIAALLNPDAATHASMLRLATSAARRGRLCGVRGRRASWGTDADAGGMVSLPVSRDDAADIEAATDAVGIVWARAAAGRYGEPHAPFPVGALYTKARNLGRLGAVRRIREHGPLTAATDRAMPVSDRAATLEALYCAIPHGRRAMAQAAVEAWSAAQDRVARQKAKRAVIRAAAQVR